MVRIWTGNASVVGTCDHCKNHEVTPGASDQVITVVTLYREEDTVLTARFCERHFLLFSDVVNEQVAALLYPPAPAGKRSQP